MDITEKEVEAAVDDIRRDDLAVSVDFAIRHAISDYKTETAKDRNLKFRSPAWLFNVALREHPDLSGLDDAAAVKKIEAAAGADVWARLPGEDSRGKSTNPRDDFIDAWSKEIKKPMRSAPAPGDVAALLEEYPLGSEWWPEEADRPYRSVATLVFWYGTASAGAFWLSCRNAGEMLGMSRTSAASHLRRLVRDGLLEVVKKHKQLPGGKAIEYRLHAEAVTLADVDRKREVA